MNGLRKLARRARRRLRVELVAAAARAGLRVFDEHGHLLRRIDPELVAAAARAGLRVFDEHGYLLRGIDLRADVQRAFPDLLSDVILDVGAHHGESTEVFLERWRCAMCHSFEPAGAAFQVLTQRLRGEPRARLWNMALGACPGTGSVVFPHGAHRSTLARVQMQGHEAGVRGGGPSETVVVDTIDGFCLRHDLERITLLKIDTEGNDLEVLRGAERMLRGGRIDLIQLELGMNPENLVHVPLEAAKRHLEALDYRLFAFYSQRREWRPRAEKLRRADAVFVRRQLAEPSIR